MAVETLKKVAVQIELENGRDAEGNMKYLNQSVQYISRSGYDGDKVLAVVGALEACLDKDLGGTNAIKTMSITAN